jgi:hypothetical protein
MIKSLKTEISLSIDFQTSCIQKVKKTNIQEKCLARRDKNSEFKRVIALRKLIFFWGEIVNTQKPIKLGGDSRIGIPLIQFTKNFSQRLKNSNLVQ